MLFKNVLEALATYFPDWLILETGAFAAFWLVALSFCFLFWQSLTKSVSGVIEDWIQKRGRVMWHLFLFLLPVMAFLVVGSFYGASAVAAVSLIGVIQYARGKIAWRMRWLVLAQLAAFVAGVGIQALMSHLRIQHMQQHLNVYVIMPLALPLEVEHENSRVERLELSRKFRGEIGKLFGGLAEVRIEPRDYKEEAELEDWEELEVAVERVLRSGLQPDLVLVNQASFIKADEEFLSLVLRAKVYSPSNVERPFSELLRIVQRSRRRNLPYLAMRVSIAIVEGLRGTPLALESPEEEQIARRILERYQDLLALEPRESVPPGIPEAVALALQSPKASYEDAKRIVNEYPRDETDFLRTAAVRKRSGLLSPFELAIAPLEEGAAAPEEPTPGGGNA